MSHQLAPEAPAQKSQTSAPLTLFLVKMIHFGKLSIWVEVQTSGPLRRVIVCPWTILQSTMAYGGLGGPLDAIHMVKFGDKTRPLGESFRVL